MSKLNIFLKYSKFWINCSLVVSYMNVQILLLEMSYIVLIIRSEVFIMASSRNVWNGSNTVCEYLGKLCIKEYVEAGCNFLFLSFQGTEMIVLCDISNHGRAEKSSFVYWWYDNQVYFLLL